VVGYSRQPIVYIRSWAADTDALDWFPDAESGRMPPFYADLIELFLHCAAARQLLPCRDAIDEAKDTTGRARSS
jgi:hypothetical protein